MHVILLPGGGGTFVFDSAASQPMLAAAGGGGAGVASSNVAFWGRPGSSSTNGSWCYVGCAGGTEGQGAVQTQANNGGPGGGWMSSSFCTISRQVCGSGRDSTFAGGFQWQAGFAEGGFGGGGAATSSGGGGGGFSGGGGGSVIASPRPQA